MSTPVAEHVMRRHEPDLFNEAAAGSVLLLLWCLGALAMMPVSASLVQLWHEDALRSIGVFIPAASLLLIVRAWRRCGWIWSGSWYGLIPVILGIAGARLLGNALIAYRFSNHAVGLLQPGIFLALYGSGVVLLVGGIRLWRACLFPLLLLFCVNPVPHLFNQVIDLPLQAASADTARAFAHALGLHPSGEQLQMLFAPRFGMVIVPGCNGIRGSITMGYLMLLLGYWRGYRPVRLASYVVAAVALGYILNLVRLCVLVLYYWAGIHMLSLRPHGEGIDYLIGGGLFLCIATLAGSLFFRGRTVEQGFSTGVAPLPWNRLLSSPRIRVLTTIMLLCALPEVPTAFAHMRSEGDRFTSSRLAMQAMPQSVGRWKRGEFSFEKQEIDGQVVWIWTPYTRPDGRNLELGIWLSPLQHYALNSRRIHGDTPLWTGSLDLKAANREPVHFTAFTMNDELSAVGAAVPTYFAETTCLPGRCSDAALGFGKRGLAVAIAPVSSHSERRLSMLVRVPEPTDGPFAASRTAAEASLQEFMSGLDVEVLTQQLGTR